MRSGHCGNYTHVLKVGDANNDNTCTCICACICLCITTVPTQCATEPVADLMACVLYRRHVDRQQLRRCPGVKSKVAKTLAQNIASSSPCIPCIPRLVLGSCRVSSR